MILLLLFAIAIFVPDAFALSNTAPFSEISVETLSSHNGADIAGFTDLNSDKTTDVLLVSKPGK